MKEIPLRDERKELVVKYHEGMNHRGLSPVYYEIKKNGIGLALKKRFRV